MKLKLPYFICLTFLIAFADISKAQPYWGTIFIDSTIVTASDPTLFVSSTYAGQGMRTVWDRRVATWITMNAFLFDIVWSDGLTSEAQINPEFGTVAAATIEAEKYGIVLGRLPTCLRQDVQALWIHKGTEVFGGGNNSILIHTGQAALYETDGILEEALIHEGTHTSLDANHAAAPGWLAAQSTDVNFISTYAATNPTTEDLSESFLTWFMVRQCIQRVSQQNFDTISYYIADRLAYLDAQNFNMYPLCVTTTGIQEVFQNNISIFPNPVRENAILRSETKFENVIVNVFNSFGERVSQLVNVNGNEINLACSELSAGIYFIQLTDKNKVIYKNKLIVLK